MPSAGQIRVIEPGADIHAALDDPLPPQAEPSAEEVAELDRALDRRLADLVDWVLADTGPAKDLGLLDEYFQAETLPPRRGDGQRRPTLRERLWTRIEARFAPARPQDDSATRDRPTPAYAGYRSRATALNYHYSGLYRGAFVLNYVLAVLAVALATLGLALMASAPEAPWLDPALFGLGAVKLAVLITIAINTYEANRRSWNDRAVDYRYLAERLRPLFYLPALGSHQPPAAARPYHFARAQHQSAVDWLFEAILRAAPPVQAQPQEAGPGHAVPGEPGVPLLHLNPRQALTLVAGPWVLGQVYYHQRNAQTQGALDRFAEWLASRLNYIVVGLVLIDLAVLGAHHYHLDFHGLVHAIHSRTEWLILATAVLPAAVAALNGLRFQGESSRLAERSEMLRILLGGHPQDPHAYPPDITGGRGQQVADLLARIDHAQADPATDPGAWSLEALRLAEAIADDCVREVADWSVLYAKELPET